MFRVQVKGRVKVRMRNKDSCSKNKSSRFSKRLRRLWSITERVWLEVWGGGVMEGMGPVEKWIDVGMVGMCVKSWHHAIGIFQK